MISKTIIIYGVGEYGKSLYNFLKKCGAEVSYFCQSNASEVPEYDGIRILRMDELNEITDKIIMIAIKDTATCERIKDQLIQMNIDRSNIFIWSDFIMKNHTDIKDKFCLLCGNYVDGFLSYGIEDDLFNRHHVIGGGSRENVICPSCKSLDRVRWQYYVLNNNTQIFSSECSVLHFAPERWISQKIKLNSKCDYYSGDIVKEHAMHKVNMTDIQFRDCYFDYIIANHVLEHVQDEKLAIQELKRVLKNSGRLILSFPICTDMVTFEDPSITSEEDRLKYYGQSNHVRLYGYDYKEHIEKHGLKVEVKTPAQSLSSEEIKKYGLIQDDIILICSKVMN